MKNTLLMIFYCYFFGVTFVQAESYYLQAVKSAQISAEKLQESRDKIKKHKDIKVQDEIEIPPFHKRNEWQKDSLSKTFCTTCHLSPPHTKDLRARAFLNMHTEFIACETCHMRPENISFNYQWLDYRNQQVITPSVNLFRQTIKEEKKQGMTSIKKEKKQEQEEEKEVRKTDVMVKIAPFVANKKALILRDHAFAEETGETWKKGTLEERVVLRAKIHTPLKEKGPECEACHQKEEPMLDLQALGANEKQTRSMQRHIVPQFFKRYTEDEQKIKINNLLK